MKIWGWCASTCADIQFSLCWEIPRATVFFSEIDVTYVKLNALSFEHSETLQIMESFREKSIFRKLLLAASPNLQIAICDSGKSFCTRRVKSNDVMNVWIGPLYAEIHFLSTRLRRRFLPPGCHCGISHSVHRCLHPWGYLLSTSCFQLVPALSQGFSL